MKLLHTLPTLLLVVLAGCTSTEAGTASPEEAQKSSDKTGSAPTTSSAQDLAKIDPCDLLTGVSGTVPVQEVEKVGSDSCRTRVGRDNALRINIRTDLGLKDYVLGQGAEPSDTTVGAHKGKIVRKTLTDLDCVVVIGVGENARVDVFVAADVSLDEGCALATEVATAIEPKLP
ncbi:DUF3558 domain-containing protein [Actinosynnema pretiosum subsp. pretiosum]|uniref:DUF3558 domain-containing protein n=1 Tax=Actinosynnema pretiosum subsp. pretiosum TaxID=103721 RepID=A0AA45L3H4_9PSEU|nr:hypothetical protein APASM_6086 [Actinosynnema pretiosum subsp. pretiosum]QUF02744.1 DUF3558 domain-containing protein [Actinosynnema pretiosum subsp. pretiosum]